MFILKWYIIYILTENNYIDPPVSERLVRVCFVPVLIPNINNET